MHVTTETKKLFRENALLALNQQSTLETAFCIVPVSAMAYLIVVLCALAALTAWSIFGVIEVEVPMQGMILNANEIENIEMRYQDYRKEQARNMQALKYLMEKKQDLYVKHYVTLDEVQRARQAYLLAEENMSIMPSLNTRGSHQLFSSSSLTGTSELVAMVFVSHKQGKQIQTGMQAYLLPGYLSYFEYGYIKGIVQQVSVYPVSREVAYAYLGNMNLVDEYFAGGAPFAIKIKLLHNESSGHDLSWTSSRTVSVVINAGLGVSGKIITKKYHPYQLFTNYYI